MGHFPLIFAFFSLLLLQGNLFGELYVSQPDENSAIHILAEGAGNASVQITRPDGSTYEIMLENGQAAIEASQQGRWEFRYEGERRAVVAGTASTEQLISYEEPEPEVDGAFFAFSGMLAVLVITIGFSIWKFFVKNPGQNYMPALSKERRGKAVRLSFTSGASPIESVEVTDNAGEGWKGRPIKIYRKHMRAREVAWVEYEFEGKLCAATASYIHEGKEYSIGQESGPNAPKHSEVPGRQATKKRKLARAAQD